MLCSARTVPNDVSLQDHLEGPVFSGIMRYIVESHPKQPPVQKTLAIKNAAVWRVHLQTWCNKTC